MVPVSIKCLDEIGLDLEHEGEIGRLGHGGKARTLWFLLDI